MKVISVIVVLILFEYPVFAQQSNVDSLLRHCIEAEIYCNDSLTVDKNFRSSLIRKDEQFMKKIVRSFRIGISVNEVADVFRKSKFVTKNEKSEMGERTFVEIYFYTNYTSGEILYLFEKERLIKYGCDIHSDYDVYCGKKDSEKFNIAGTFDIPFFKKHVIPYFIAQNIRSACSQLIVADIWDLRDQPFY